MLREIAMGRRDGRHGVRRWFQDEYFDLYVWSDDAGEPIAFQLCYDRAGSEGAITWSWRSGFGHDRVDEGDESPKRLMTPILRADGAPPYFRIRDRFIAASGGCPHDVRDLVLGRLNEYRYELFGRPRKPRRRKRAPAVDSGTGAE